MSTSHTVMNLNAAQAGQMSADELLEALRVLRQSPVDEAYWTRFSLCLTALCRASAALVLQLEARKWEMLGAHGDVNSRWVADVPQWMNDLGERALRQGQAYQPHPELGFVVVVRLQHDTQPTVVLLTIAAKEKANLNELMLRARLVADLPKGEGVESSSNATVDSPLLNLLDLSAKVMHEQSFGAAALSLVNGLAALRLCEQAVLGWLEPSGYVRVQAISHLDRFERKMESTVLVEAALEEAIDQHGDVIYPPPVDSTAVTVAHERLQRVLGNTHMATLVLGQGGHHGTAALLLTRAEGPLDGPTLDALNVVLHLMLPWLSESKARSRAWYRRAWDYFSQRVRNWFSPEKPGIKAVVALVLAGVLFLVFGSWPHRIEAGAELVTDSTQIVSAPFDGYLGKVQVALGDTVQQGQDLAVLDTGELVLQLADYASEVNRFTTEADRARALDEGANTEIALARARQAQAKHDRAKFQVDQATLKAPFDGVIVEGERKELTGMPVHQGDQVFKLARIEGLYALVSVSEREIHFIPSDAHGEIRLLSAPDQPIPFELDKLVPMAQVQGKAGNTFLMKVKLLSDVRPWWRPGMSGLALIEAGDRNVLWLLTHRMIDFIRLKLWW